jgi:hypothetical protein
MTSLLNKPTHKGSRTSLLESDSVDESIWLEEVRFSLAFGET